LLIGYVFAFTVLDHWVIDGGFGAWTRAGMLIVVVLLCSAILIRYVAMPWFRRIHPLYAARMLDRSSQGLEGSLLALIDLQSGGRKNDTPIQKSLEKRAAVKLAEVHVDEAIDRRMLIRLGTALFVITLLTCLYAVFSPKAISLLRPLTLAAANVSTRTVVETVLPGNKKVPAGTRIEFVADIAGVIPEDVRVLYTTADKRYVDEPLQMRATEDKNRFQVLMIGDGDRGVRQDIKYRIVAGDASSEEYLISVNQPPTAQVNEVKYVYPTYMQLSDRVDTSGAIDAWEGSVVTIHAQSSVPVKSAILQLSDDAGFTAHGEEVAMVIKDTALTGELKLDVRADQSVPKFYRITVTDEDGDSDPEPVVYPLEIRRDQPPIVKLLDPNRDLQVPANAIVPLLVEAEDPDFLLRSVTLNYSINGKPVQPSEVLLDTSGIPLPKKWSDTWEFRLSTLKLTPGDVVTYHVQARDNRPPLGNQGRSGDLKSADLRSDR
jgi:collagen type III alpha